MMNEGNKCLPPPVITLPQHRGGGAKKCLRADIFPPTSPSLWQKPIVRPCLQTNAKASLFKLFHSVACSLNPSVRAEKN